MKRLALLFAVGGIILAVIMGYAALSGEMTGRTFSYDANAHPGWNLRSRGAFVSVLRDRSPTEFRHANNFLWAVSALSIAAAGIGIYFFRGIDDNE
jgi:hypothetical protein